MEETDTTTPNLKLDAADKLSGKIKVKDNKVIEVTDGEGLILLSNVKPEYYVDYEIELITTTGWDLTQPVALNGTSYKFLDWVMKPILMKECLGLDQEPQATLCILIATSSSSLMCFRQKQNLEQSHFVFQKAHLPCRNPCWQES